MVGEGCDDANINNWIHDIEQLDHLTDIDKARLDAINADLTQILVDADAKCQPFQTYPWSPDLHMTYLDHRFWSVSLSVKHTKCPHTQALETIKDCLGAKFLPLSPPDTISIRLRWACHKLWEIRCKAFQCQQQHLNNLLRNARASKDNDRKQLILCLKHTEETR